MFRTSTSTTCIKRWQQQQLKQPQSILGLSLFYSQLTRKQNVCVQCVTCHLSLLNKLTNAFRMECGRFLQFQKLRLTKIKEKSLPLYDSMWESSPTFERILSQSSKVKLL